MAERTQSELWVDLNHTDTRLRHEGEIPFHQRVLPMARQRDTGFWYVMRGFVSGMVMVEEVHDSRFMVVTDGVDHQTPFDFTRCRGGLRGIGRMLGRSIEESEIEMLFTRLLEEHPTGSEDFALGEVAVVGRDQKVKFYGRDTVVDFGIWKRTNIGGKTFLVNHGNNNGHRGVR